MGLPAAPASDNPLSPGSSQWLDVRVIYVRVCAPAIASIQAPESLVFRCNPRDFRSELEMNGARIPPSERACLTLRLDRVDEDCSEAMYVSTDKLRLSSSLPFSIFHEDEQLAEGLVCCREALPSPWAAGMEDRATPPGGGLEWHPDSPVSSSGGAQQAASRPPEWGMRCTCTVSQGWSGFNVKSLQDFTTGQPVQPALEMCLVGKCGGASVMLTDSVQLLCRKRTWKGALDAIPESEDSTHGGMVVARTGLQEDGRGLYLLDDKHHLEAGGKLEDTSGSVTDQRQQGMFLEGLWPTQAGLSGLYGDTEENGEMTWFNAGVRVGVGIGLGMCIGMGIGVGLIVKTYQATTRPFRGRLL